MCAFPQTALSKLAVEVLQWRFDALLRERTQWLNATYKVAGLISRWGTKRLLQRLDNLFEGGMSQSVIDLLTVTFTAEHAEGAHFSEMLREIGLTDPRQLLQLTDTHLPSQ